MKPATQRMQLLTQAVCAGCDCGLQVNGKVFRIGHLGNMDELMMCSAISGAEMAMRDAGTCVSGLSLFPRLLKGGHRSRQGSIVLGSGLVSRLVKQGHRSRQGSATWAAVGSA